MAAPDETEGLIPPAVYSHCVNVYATMMDQAEEVPLTDDDDESVTGLVWTGFTTKLFSDLGLAVPYYSQCTRLLKAMDCIRQLRRGGGGSPSQWLLMQEPSVQLYEAVKDAPGMSHPSERANRDQIMEQRLRDLQRQIDEMSAAQDG